MSDTSELPSLLFRQRLLLAMLAGAVCLRDPVLGMAALLLGVAVPQRMSLFRAGLLTLFFLIGLGVTFLAAPVAPDCPSWASVPGKSVLAEGRIAAVTGLPGGRVRVLLEQVRPMKSMPSLSRTVEMQVKKALGRPPEPVPAGMRKGYPGAVVEDDVSPVPGRVGMTLYADDMKSSGRPVQGQTLRALMRLYPISGSVNPGTSDLRTYWADRDVWHNARVNRTRQGPLFLELEEGEGMMYRAFRMREDWRSTVEKALAESAGSKKGVESGTDGGGYWGGESALSCSQGRAMLLALIFGDRSVLAPETVDLFTRAGLVHSLALSGQHLALAVMVSAACIFVLARIFNTLFLSIPRRILVAAAGIPFAVVYLFIGGAPFSLIRAACMMLSGAVFLCLCRPAAPMDALLAACLLLFIGWPLAVFDLSAQLSVLAVAGILFSMPLISILRDRFPPASLKDTVHLSDRPRLAAHAFIRWVGSMLIISVAAQIAVLPVLVSVFGVVSTNLWMNLIWLPPLTFITLPAAAAGMFLLVLFGPQICSEMLFTAAAWPADAMLQLLSDMAQEGSLPFIQCFRPSSLTSLGYMALMAGMVMWCGTRLRGRESSVESRRLLFFGLLLLPLGQMPTWLEDIRAEWNRTVSLTVLDVGQGQAVLLEYPGGRVLVDGGGSSSPFFDYGRSIVAPALTYRHMPRLDAVIVSHTDMDHARGLRWILEHFDVGRLCWSPVSASDDSADAVALRETARRRGIPEHLLVRGDVLELSDGVKLEVVWPDMTELPTLHRKRPASDNDASLAMRLMRDDVPVAFLCGDMTASALRRLTQSGQNLRAGILVLPHHGAASSFQKTFYDAVSPDVALASAASFNHYGFPSRKVSNEMRRRLIPLYSTSERGGISVTWSGPEGTMELH